MRVYIAGPITLGNQAENVRRAVKLADELMFRGHAPFVPHLSWFWEYLTGKRDPETWLRLDFAWLECCDALIRLPGVSEGADREEVAARALGIPVFYDVGNFLTWAKERAA